MFTCRRSIEMSEMELADYFERVTAALTFIDFKPSVRSATSLDFYSPGIRYGLVNRNHALTIFNRLGISWSSGRLEVVASSLHPLYVFVIPMILGAFCLYSINSLQSGSYGPSESTVSLIFPMLFFLSFLVFGFLFIRSGVRKELDKLLNL